MAFDIGVVRDRKWEGGADTWAGACRGIWGGGESVVCKRVGIFLGDGGFGGWTMSRWATFGERKRISLV